MAKKETKTGQITAANSPKPAASNDTAQPGNAEPQAGENQPAGENHNEPSVDEKAPPKEIKIKLLDRLPPYRRAGLVFEERENVVDANTLSEEQIERLTRDPSIEMMEV